jgi:hypothetical protein
MFGPTRLELGFPASMQATGVLPAPALYDRGFLDQSPIVPFYLVDGPRLEESRALDAARFDPILPYEWIDDGRLSRARGALAETEHEIRLHPSAIGHMLRVSSSWEDIPCRHVLRPTRAYFAAFTAANVQEVLHDRPFADTLDLFLRQSIPDELVSSVVSYELDQLSLGVIPTFRFAAGSTTLTSSHNRAWDGFFSTSGLSRAQDRLRAWHLNRSVQASDQDQRGLEILGPGIGRRFVSGGGSSRATLERAVQESLSIARRRSFRASDGQLLWRDIAPTGSDRGIAIQALGLGLYRGSAGIGLSLAAAESAGLQPQLRWQDCFIQFENWLDGRAGPAEDLSPALDVGAAGILYAQALSHKVSGTPFDSSKIITTLRKIRNLTSSLDTMSGLAGIVLCLDAADRMFPVESADRPELTADFGTMAAALASSSESAPRQTEMYRPGLAHGLTGAAFALFRLTRHGIVTNFANLLPDLQEEARAATSETNYSWCAGTSGIARCLARMGIPPKEPCAHPNDASFQLCCGLLGPLLANFEIGYIGADDVVEALARVVSDKRGVRSFAIGRQSEWATSLFQGAGGVTYHAASLLGGAPLPAFEMFD